MTEVFKVLLKMMEYASKLDLPLRNKIIFNIKVQNDTFVLINASKFLNDDPIPIPV